ncbi:hypothetical protein HPGCJGGD_2030 [Methylobacterium haplocladii]|nr:hypothetical protein HPGCJGGD_2030 [Methylobacterium haplocladii]
MQTVSAFPTSVGGSGSRVPLRGPEMTVVSSTPAILIPSET